MSGKRHQYRCLSDCTFNFVLNYRSQYRSYYRSCNQAFFRKLLNLLEYCTPSSTRAELKLFYEIRAEIYFRENRPDVQFLSGLLACTRRFSTDLFFAFQSSYQRGLGQSYCLPVNRLSKACYDGP